MFCNLVITLQFRIIVEKAYDAFYRLTDPSEQIQSFAFDVIRSKVPKMTLDEVFSCKSDIAREVQNKLEKVLCDYGYEILNALLTDVRPVDKVVQSMNEINASKRLKTVSFVTLAFSFLCMHNVNELVTRVLFVNLELGKIYYFYHDCIL